MTRPRFPSLLLGSLLALTAVLGAQGLDKDERTAARGVCPPCVRAHMEFLASDALRGRGSGTHDELVAATYVASQFQQYGLEPAGDQGSFVQRVALVRRKLTAPPKLSFRVGAGEASRKISYAHGKEILVLHLGSGTFSGPLQKIDLDQVENPTAKAGSIILLTSKDAARAGRATFQLVAQGAAAILLPESPSIRQRWKSLAGKLPELPVKVEGVSSSAHDEHNVLALSQNAAAAVSALRDGTAIQFKCTASPPTRSYTWNVVARISGSDPSQQNAVILLTAHVDHLGVGLPVNGDEIYNGADDDASGVTAVLELGRYLALQAKPRRSVIFALFGSEEKGALGSAYFREHPPVALSSIAAYLEFEMIGRRDPAVPEDTLWLTGWERSNLGPELASHGAHLVADPHPDQGFFRRSDNYVFAKKGIVAQTVSSYGLHTDYHQPSDDLAHIDFDHMDRVIDSLLGPILWLVNSDFMPHWNQGQQP